MLLTVSDGVSSFVQFITVLIIFVFVLAITYFSTKWIADYQKGKAVCKNLDVIETHRISNNKYLQIVKAGEKYLVIAVCKDTITMLTELNVEQIDFSTAHSEESMGFKELLQKAKDLKFQERLKDSNVKK